MSMKKMRKILILRNLSFLCTGLFRGFRRRFEDDFDDDVIFDEKDGDVEVEVKVINGKVSDNEQKKPEASDTNTDKEEAEETEKEESADDTEETETIILKKCNNFTMLKNYEE